MNNTTYSKKNSMKYLEHFNKNFNNEKYGRPVEVIKTKIKVN